MKIISEWFFDPIYDEQSKQLIHEDLGRLISEWVEATCPKLDSRRKRGGASIDGSTADNKVWFLSILLRDDRPPGDWHSLTYVGPEGSVLNRHDEVKAYITERFHHPGAKGLMIERDF